MVVLMMHQIVHQLMPIPATYPFHPRTRSATFCGVNAVAFWGTVNRIED